MVLESEVMAVDRVQSVPVELRTYGQNDFTKLNATASFFIKFLSLSCGLDVNLLNHLREKYFPAYVCARVKAEMFETILTSCYCS